MDSSSHTGEQDSQPAAQEPWIPTGEPDLGPVLSGAGRWAAGGGQSVAGQRGEHIPGLRLAGQAGDDGAVEFVADRLRCGVGPVAGGGGRAAQRHDVLRIHRELPSVGGHGRVTVAHQRTGT